MIERKGLLIANSASESSYVPDKQRRQPGNFLPPFTTPGTVKFRRLPATESQQAVIKIATQQLQTTFRDLANIQAPYKLDISIEGQRHLLQVFPYHDNYDLDWLVVTVVPRSECNGQSYGHFQLAMLVCGFTSLAIVGIAV